MTARDSAMPNVGYSRTDANARQAEAAMSIWSSTGTCLSPTPAATSFGLRPRRRHSPLISPMAKTAEGEIRGLH
jgi:hypothetical protein